MGREYQLDRRDICSVFKVQSEMCLRNFSKISTTYLNIEKTIKTKSGYYVKYFVNQGCNNNNVYKNLVYLKLES